MNKPNEIVNPESVGSGALRSVNDNVEKGPADSRPWAGCYAMGGVVPKGRAATSRVGFASEYSSTNAWNQNNNGNVNNNNKDNNNTNNRVRSVSALATSLSSLPTGSLFYQDADGKIRLEDLFEAYYDCRRNKRKTANALRFEFDYEHNLIELCNEINEGRYVISRSIAFVVSKPVFREVFAADFRDRIVHHYLIARLNPLFERLFIADSYSCREGKGTLYGVRRIAAFIDECSCHYTKTAYVLKLDIEGFFMHIDKALLKQRLTYFIEEQYFGPDKRIVIGLCRQIIDNDPTEDCIIKGKRSDWNNLPASKSLFHVGPGKGLPIGNLTSQIFANFYLNPLDKFVTSTLGFSYYGRYVDDFIIVHSDKDRLKHAVEEIRAFLNDNLLLRLHPRKIYLQPCNNGVKYIGAVIKPGRTYIANRTKGNCYNSIVKHNAVANDHRPDSDEIAAFQASINSYFGIMCHYNTYHVCKKMKKRFSPYWWNHVQISKGYVQPRKRKLRKDEIHE